MATESGPKSKNAATATVRNSMASKSAVSTAASRAGATVSESPSSAIEAAFKEDDKVREVFTKHLAARTRDSKRVAKRATDAFKHFRPSLFTTDQREKRTYLAPDESLADSVQTVLEKGVAAMRASARRHTLKIHIGDACGASSTAARFRLRI
jgi:hypothetical protein